MSANFRDLVVWKRAVDLAVEVNAATKSFPKEELFGLTSQMRRSAVSVASNIAEGQGRLTKGEFLHFLGQARGSLLELETQFVIAERSGFLVPDAARELEVRAEEVSRLLNGLISSLRRTKPET
jgi:four helix bundle protein